MTGIELRACTSAALIVVTAAVSTGCSRTNEWTEEVQLSNGEVIVIERETRHKPGGSELAIGSGWKPTEYLIRFEYPKGSGKKIEWRSKKLSPAKYPEFPLIFDYDAAVGAFSLIAIHSISEVCDVYIRYELGASGGWLEKTLPEQFPVKITNLYLSAAAQKLPDFVDINIKTSENSDFRYRKRLKEVGPGRTVCGY